MLGIKKISECGISSTLVDVRIVMQGALLCNASAIIGLKLKGLRTISKREFVKKSGLSLSKINVIEDYCFLAKMNDVRIYAEKGLEKNLSMIIKFIDKNLKNIN